MSLTLRFKPVFSAVAQGGGRAEELNPESTDAVIGKQDKSVRFGMNI